MTAPHQPLPATVEQLLGFGAFEIGSAAYSFGQNVTHDIATALIRGPGAALAAAGTDIVAFLSALGSYLATLPLEALQWVQQYIPGTVLAEFATVESAVAAIMNNLKVNILLGAQEFETWLSAVFNVLQTMVNQIISIVNGDVVTPINSAVTEFKDWFTGLTGWRGTTDGTLTSLATAAQSLINLLFDIFGGGSGATGKTLTDVLSVGSSFYTLVTTVSSNIQTLLNNLYDIFNGTVGSTSKTLANVLTIGQTFYTTVGTIQTNLQTLLNNLFDAFNGTTGSVGKTLANVLTAGQSFFSGAAGAATSFATLLSTTSQGSATALGTLINTVVTMVNQITDIFNGSVVTPINTAVQHVKDWWTATGASLPTAITNASSAVSQWTSAIANAGAANAAGVGTAVATAQTNAQGLVQSVNDAAAGVASGASSLLATAQANIASLFGGAPQYLQGLSGAFGQGATNTAYAAASSAAAAQATQLSQQQSALNAVFNVSPASAGNVNVNVDFTTVANQTGMSGIMLPGTSSGTGFMGVTSGAATYQPASPPTSDVEVFPTQTVSDYQVITATLGALNDLASGAANSEIIGRSNSARNTFVSVRLLSPGSPVLLLSACVSGTYTTLGTSSSIPGMSSGGVIKVILGDIPSLSLYAMQVLYNGTPVITVTDASHVSQLGSGQRYVGLKMSGASFYVPPAIKSVTYQDNPPPPATYPFSGLPAAGTKGRFYLPSDVGLALRDNGSSWERFLGGPLGYFTAPPSSGWSAVNGGTTTFAADKDATLLTAPSIASSESYHLWVRTLTPASNYTATFYLECLGAPTSTWIASIVLRNSTSGSFVTFDVGVDTPDAGVGLGDSTGCFMSVTKRTSPSALSASYKDVGTRFFSGGLPNWLRIRDDGTLRYCEYSHNGVDWMTFHSVSRTDFITPNQIGLSAFNLATGQPVTVRLRSLAGIS